MTLPDAISAALWTAALSLLLGLPLAAYAPSRPVYPAVLCAGG